MLKREKNFTIIVQKSNPFILRNSQNYLEELEEFNDQAFGHAVMVLKIGEDLYCRGYRPDITGSIKIRNFCFHLYTRNTPISEKERKEINKQKESFFQERFKAQICEEVTYRNHHKKRPTGKANDKFAYEDWNCEEDEMNAIWERIKQDEENKKKYYALKPDTVRKSGKYEHGSLVHNCVTWIIETLHQSVTSFHLDPVDDGNISQFFNNLHKTGNNV